MHIHRERRKKMKIIFILRILDILAREKVKWNFKAIYLENMSAGDLYVFLVF